MEVILRSIANKEYLRLNEPIKGRIEQALEKLSCDPPKGDIKKLVGGDGYRVRVGDYRILYDMDGERITVYGIKPRGQAYKGGQ
ncbi:MAG: type II toxin-antitoxin system RelE/ParE family toxin [Oscillospiraceae bacterium]|jgi:mRNA interferase RelE/StbE|nr:type II toxin-antitoxin system RelE/ParE family toxin [Oscillospiraceae bacterium]